MIHQVLIILENVKLQFSGKLAKDITTQWSTSCGKKIVKNILQDTKTVSSPNQLSDT